jgi:hypothetical protein
MLMTHISKWEELKMGTPTFKTDKWRVSNEFLDSDVVQIIRDELADSDEEGEDQGMLIEYDLERTDVEGRARK